MDVVLAGCGEHVVSCEAVVCVLLAFCRERVVSVVLKVVGSHDASVKCAVS